MKGLALRWSVGLTVALTACAPLTTGQSLGQVATVDVRGIGLNPRVKQPLVPNSRKSGRTGPSEAKRGLHKDKSTGERLLSAYTIYSCSWTDGVDQDGDGYTRYRTLQTDVDVDDGTTHTVYLKVYRKLSSSSTYTLYYTSPNSEITGIEVDPILVAIGVPNLELSHNTYDFQVEVYEAGGTVVEASRDAAEDEELDDQAFETTAQDAPILVYTIDNCWWTDDVDQDGDGYTRYRTLQTDVDVDDGMTHTVYLKVYCKLSSSSTYTVYYTSPNSQITGIEVDPILTAIGVPNLELDYATYDFQVEVYEAGGTQDKASRDATGDWDLDDQAFETAALDAPVPIQLASFTCKPSPGGQALLEWVTVSESNNYGFEVQRRGVTESAYVTLPNSFVPGHGTTILAHRYSYVDTSVRCGAWLYRLKQMDLDGTTHYSEGVQLNVMTDVRQSYVPTEFSLAQNYPNPFNPSTTIRYALPVEANVNLVVYDLLGREVARLVEERMSAGYHTTVFDASPFGSGIYFYRLSASTSFSRTDNVPAGLPQTSVQTRRLLVVK